MAAATRIPRSVPRLRRHFGLLARVRRNHGSRQPANRITPGQCQLCVLQTGGERYAIELQCHFQSRQQLHLQRRNLRHHRHALRRGQSQLHYVSGDTYGILNGYNAGTGYDQATGLGSVNANNLVTQWSSVTSLPSTTTLNSLTPTTITHGQTGKFHRHRHAAVRHGTPTGEISLLGGVSGKSPASIGFNLSSGAVSGTTDLLPGGTYSVTRTIPATVPTRPAIPIRSASP